jgi:hypothetical protein
MCGITLLNVNTLLLSHPDCRGGGVVPMTQGFGPMREKFPGVCNIQKIIT